MPILTKVRAAFDEKVDVVAPAEGMPRSALHRLGLKMFDGTEHLLSRLVEELPISRGNVSASVPLLDERDLTQRMRLYDGTNLYQSTSAGLSHDLRDLDTLALKRAPDGDETDV